MKIPVKLKPDKYSPRRLAFWALATVLALGATVRNDYAQGGGAVIVVYPTTLSYSAWVGTGNPPNQEVDIFTTSSGWDAAITSITGGNWLTLSPTSGFEDDTITVSVNSSSPPLGVGNYSAAVTVSAPGAAPQTVMVSLTVNPPPNLQLGTSSLTFTGNSPASQQLTINTSGPDIDWTATLSTSSGGSWLKLSAGSGRTPSSDTVSVNTVGLNAGTTYQGTITITSVHASNSPLKVNVILTTAPSPPPPPPPTPTIEPGGIVNGASFSTQAVVSAGAITSLFGTNLAASPVIARTAILETGSTEISIPLPTVLAGTQVLVNNIAAPLFYVSPNQINFQMPFEVYGSTAQVVVISNSAQSLPATAQVTPVAPGIFTVPSIGMAQGAVLNQDFSMNSPANPTLAGSAVMIYTTGLGATIPLSNTGQAGGTSPLSITVQTPVVLVDGAPAMVLFSGLAPGFVGLYQVNAQIPAGMPANPAVSVQIQMGGQSSNIVDIAVK